MEGVGHPGSLQQKVLGSIPGIAKRLEIMVPAEANTVLMINGSYIYEALRDGQGPTSQGTKSSKS